MNIEIIKKQETINDVPKDVQYSFIITREYGTGAFNRKEYDYLSRFSLKDIENLRDRLNKDFPSKLP